MAPSLPYPSAGTPQQWAEDLLAALGAPATGPKDPRVEFIEGWQKVEGNPPGSQTYAAEHNPLSTSQPAAGSTAVNSSGVQAYATVPVGVDATVQTLQHGYDAPIFQALRTPDQAKGHPISIATLTNALAESNWSGYGAGSTNESAYAQAVGNAAPLTGSQRQDQSTVIAGGGLQGYADLFGIVPQSLQDQLYHDTAPSTAFHAISSGVSSGAHDVASGLLGSLGRSVLGVLGSGTVAEIAIRGLEIVAGALLMGTGIAMLVIALAKPDQGQGGTPCAGGSGVDGVKRPWELPSPGDPDFQEGETPEGLPPVEVKLVVAMTAHAIKKHVEAKGRGSVPAGILRWAEDILEPEPIPWDALLTSRVRYYMDTRRGPVASYARPSRRGAGGLVLPVHRAPQHEVVIVGDTSGSMGDRDLAVVIGTVYQAVETLGSVKALGCDAAAVEPVEVRHIEDLRAALAGGGGTDMSVGVAKAAEGDPDAIVVVTDGDTPWPAVQPEVPVIIVLTRSSRYGSPPPAWAEVIDASDVR